MSGSSQESARAPPFSCVPGLPSFRASSLNAIAMVPLLSTDKDGMELNSESAQSFRALMGSLSRYAKTSGKGAANMMTPAAVADKQEGMTEVDLEEEEHDGSDLLLVVPNSQLTRPGDWRYDSTPLRSFHWSNGCQRMLCFDGRPHLNRMAHDRLLNSSVGRDWVDLIPNRRTAAVVGILNVKDCPDLATFQKAEHELQQWAQRYSAPPYEVTAHGRSFARDEVVQRLFVFDSFDEECRKRIDLTGKRNMIAFPPSDDAHHHMIYLHLNVVLNDLAVAIFRQLETKIKDSDTTSKDKGAPAWNNNNKRKGSSGGADGPVDAKAKAANLSITQIASVVNPENELAATVKEDAKAAAKKTRTAIKAMTQSAGRLMHGNRKQAAQPQLLTPLDDFWDYSELSPKDADAMKKRDVGRREKLAADLSLLAGSPIDAYERYTRAAELTKAAHDPLWYSASLEGCAASFVAMAEAGGHCVDDYLENNFQLPESMMVLASSKEDSSKSKSSTVVDKTKTTLPAAVFALCEEALSITSRHPKLAPLHAELLLKLAWYTAETEESHLRCRWGEEVGCYSGEAGDKPRWERNAIAKLYGDLLTKSKDGKEFLALDSMERCKKWTELLHRASSTGALDPRTRADVAAACARMCLGGLRATRWGPPQRLRLFRKSAFFTVVAAESLSQCGDDQETNAATLWLAACQAYARTGNTFGDGSNYGWATLRASTLHALSQQQDYFSSEAAAELLLALLSKISPAQVGDADVLERINSSDYDDMPLSDDSIHSMGPVGEGRPIVEPDVPQTVASSAFGKRASIAPRSFFAPEQKSSLLTVAQSKWTDDEAIPYLQIPLVDPNHIVSAASGRNNVLKDSIMDASLSRSLISLNCVLPKVQPVSCGLAQKRCINLISDLRQELPTMSSPAEDTEEEIFPIYGSNDKSVPPPLHIVTARAVKSESHLVLERSKAFGFSGKATGAMATFFNPYDTKKKQEEKKVQATLVAEGEERAVLIEFSSSLSVPLQIPSCQLDFESQDKDRIKAPPLSFIVPPMAKNYAVHFPFIVLPSPSSDTSAMEAGESTEETESEPDIFEVKGLRVASLNRSFFLPITTKPPEDETDINDEQQVPDSASVYQRSSHNAPSMPEEQSNPRFEAVPAQPHLSVLFTESSTPIEDGTIVPVHLSDGEIFKIPTFRLMNDFGQSGMGKMERLQILGVGLPGVPDEVLFDTDEEAAAREEDDLTASDVSESSTDDFGDLMEVDGLPPLRMKAMCDGLSLKRINDKGSGKGGTVVFQIAATHDMGNQLANGGNVRIRFRYRGLSPTPATEIWRKREVSLRIVRVKGPRISSLTFRSDLSWGSAYSELCKALAQQRLELGPGTLSKPFAPPNRQSSDLSENPSEKKDEEPSLLSRVGVDQGVHVSGNDVVVLMAVANETNSTIVLSNRLGLVGGFEGSPMPTVRVTSGVSVKIPVVIPRIDRVGIGNSVTDIAAELIARTALQWRSEVDEDDSGVAANRRVRQGRVRIPSRCLREIISEHPAFVPRICKPPVSVKVSIAKRDGPAEKNLTVSPGAPVDTFVEVENADWVPSEVLAKCKVTLEFCCARQGDSDVLKEDNDQKYVWVGRVRRSVRPDEKDKKHRARIVFLEEGAYVVSACARVSKESSGEIEETWWAPQAENVYVEKLNFEESFRVESFRGSSFRGLK